MDKASVSGAEDCGFESHMGFLIFLPIVYFLALCKFPFMIQEK